MCIVIGQSVWKSWSYRQMCWWNKERVQGFHK